MAKIHKGIGIADGFAYKGKALNFSRDVYDNFTDLNADETNYGFPEGFKTVVKDPTDNADFSADAYKWGTFIYTNSEWRLASYVDLDSYLIFSASNEFNLNDVSGISAAGTPVAGEVWATNGSTINLNSYATNDYLTKTLAGYAKLESADFKALSLNGAAVATQTWTDTRINTALTQALTYKGGIAKQSDITDAEATGTIKLGNVYVCTTENNYTLNGGTVRLEAGDTLICKSITGTEKWNIVQANITGAVTKSSNLASGQLVVGTGLSSVKALDAGANGKFLKVENNVLTWGDFPLFNGKQNGLVPMPAEDDKATGSFLSIDGTWKIPHDTTYDDATTTARGLMTAADKIKLNGIEAGANKYSHPATHPATMITGLANVATSGSYSDLSNKPGTMNGASASASGTSGFVPVPAMGQQGLFLRGDGTWAKPTDTVYTLKAATANNLGGIKIGYMSDVTNKKYAVELDNEKAFVTVPWTNTTYEKFKPATDGLVPAPGADNTTKFLRGDGSWAMPADTVYTAGTGISIDNKVIKNTGIRTLDIDLAEGSKNTIEVNINGSTKTITINNVDHATSADSAKNATNAAVANHVANNLDVFTLVSPTSETKKQEYFNGSTSLTIDCILPSDIEKMFQ